MLAAITAGLAFLALITPLVGAESPGARVGWLLALISLLIAFPLINTSLVSLPALRLLVAIFFPVDVVRYAIQAIRQKERMERRLAAAAALGNAASFDSSCFRAPVQRRGL
jgi:hypothetical protein